MSAFGIFLRFGLCALCQECLWQLSWDLGNLRTRFTPYVGSALAFSWDLDIQGFAYFAYFMGVPMSRVSCTLSWDLRSRSPFYSSYHASYVKSASAFSWHLDRVPYARSAIAPSWDLGFARPSLTASCPVTCAKIFLPLPCFATG